jgi:alpha-methylacyl-CoA racemase
MKPLLGVKVIDLSTLLPGPLTSAYLAMLGAEVIKIEPPGGDPARSFPELFKVLNKDKKMITLNLKDDGDRETLYEYIKDADILLENFKPGTTKKLGIDYPLISGINKKLTYCSLIGYQESHQLHNFAGHDINFLGLSGLLTLLKNRKDQSLQLPNFQLADIAGGTFPAVSAILCGLYKATKDQQGVHVNVSILENLKPLYTFISQALNVQTGFSNILSGEEACYGIYKTKDAEHMCLGAFEEKFFKTFVLHLGLPELENSHHKASYQKINVKDALTEKILSKTQSEWIKIFEGIDCCFTPVLSPEPFDLVPPFYYSID